VRRSAMARDLLCEERTPPSSAATSKAELLDDHSRGVTTIGG
jgi:hypothetical protein